MGSTEAVHPYAVRPGQTDERKRKEIDPQSFCQQGHIYDDSWVSCSRPISIIPTHLLIYRAGAIAKELSPTGTMAGGPRSPLADLGRSKVTADTRRHNLASSGSEPSRDSSLPKMSDADPVASQAGTLASAGQYNSTGAQGIQQGW